MKLTKQEISIAVKEYAAQHGYFVQTVYDVSKLRYAAIKEFKNKRPHYK